MRRAFDLAALALAAPLAWGQANWRQVAVPIYDASAYASGEALFLQERADRFAAESTGLGKAITAYCDAAPAANMRTARAQWRATVAAWDALAAQSTGPLIERRSARSIDFAPVRSPLLQRAIAAAPTTVQDLDAVGAPARGFAALEWLLWHDKVKPRSAACSYATLVALDIGREADALAVAARARAEEDLEPEEAAARLGESVNQWVGGIEQLRWAFMRKPLEVADTRGEAPAYPRSLGGQTAAAWRARWETLRAAAVLGQRAVPVPGEASVPFETLLRGRGLNDLADQLVATSDWVDGTFRSLAPKDPGSVRAAAAALGALAQFAQDRLAPALAVSIGFSDADGD